MRQIFDRSIREIRRKRGYLRKEKNACSKKDIEMRIDIGYN